MKKSSSKVIDYRVRVSDFHVQNLEYSPIKGPEGNIEYLVHLENGTDGAKEESVDIDAVVEAAHAELA